MTNRIDTIIADRGRTHGSFTRTAGTAAALMGVIDCGTNAPRLTHVQRVALTQICVKLARILEGDPNERDHWDDVAGYATLVAEALPVKKNGGMKHDDPGEVFVRG